VELEGYTILHVSDIHFDEVVSKNRLLWQQLHETTADVVLITGDFITHDSYIAALCDYLAGCKAADGIFGILGNHDYYYRTLWQHFRHQILGKDYIPNDWKRLVDALSQLGIRVLINENISFISRRGVKIFIEGTDDPVLGNPEIEDPTQDYQSAAIKILLSHSPDILYSSKIKKKAFDVLLSGHTHGGQIRVPGFGPLMTGTHYAKRNEAYGLYRAGDMYVNVSAGIGYSLMPLRINCPSEITLIELSS
jgi:uncharacterized protein